MTSHNFKNPKTRVELDVKKKKKKFGHPHAHDIYTTSKVGGLSHFKINIL